MNERTVTPALGAECCVIDGLQAVVAIPVRDEERYVAGCLHALAEQVGLPPYGIGILLFLNNCSDRTADVIATTDVPWPMRVVAVTAAEASAGWARRQAMDAAAAWLREGGSADGLILTTDADSRVAPDWVRRNLDHVAAGADAVAGRISLDPAEAALLPPSLHARGRLESAYEALLTELGARLDPDAAGPWPCHWTASGATLATRRLAYEAVGGVPTLPHGEDRALLDALRAGGFAVHHAMDIAVVTSGRLDGRAAGGAAETMRRRCEQPDSPCDDRLEPPARALARVLVRCWLRRLHRHRRLGRTIRWAPPLAIPRAEAAAIGAMPSFAAAHAAIEAASPRLRYRPITPSRLPRAISRARRLVMAMRALERWRAARRGGTRPTAPAPSPG